jgi:hypothetical protein
MTAQDVYLSTVKSLPAAEQLRLAVIILEELSSVVEFIDVSGAWSDQDVRDITAFSAREIQN